jgi:hypothetical protein
LYLAGRFVITQSTLAGQTGGLQLLSTEGMLSTLLKVTVLYVPLRDV